MILAIVGSTVGVREDAVPIIRRLIDTYHPRAIITGGAIGVDSWAEEIAKDEFQLTVIICKPAFDHWNAYRDRNDIIALLCDHLVRIVSLRSSTYGSGYTRDQAKKRYKPTQEFQIP